MMHAAVNCLVKEASRKFVCASIGRRVRRSVTPYPWRNTALPFLMTITAAPGASDDFSGAKIASICDDETCAKTDRAKRKTIRTMTTSLNFIRTMLRRGLNTSSKPDATRVQCGHPERSRSTSERRTASTRDVPTTQDVITITLSQSATKILSSPLSTPISPNSLQSFTKYFRENVHFALPNLLF